MEDIRRSITRAEFVKMSRWGSFLYIGLLTSILAAMACGDVPVKWLLWRRSLHLLRYLWHHQRGRNQARPKLVCLLPNTANLIVNLTSSPCYTIPHRLTRR